MEFFISRAVAVASSNLFRCIMSRRDIIGPAGASPPSRTTGPRSLHVFIRSVCQIPLISKCLLRQYFLTKRYSNFFYFDHIHVPTYTCMVHLGYGLSVAA